LREFVTVEIIAETAFAHYGLLAANLGKKASTNLEAIQSANTHKTCTEIFDHLK
jgi:hypothetical protein